MIARILSLLFPPVLPGRIRDWEERVVVETQEQGWAGNVKRRYRDGIERYFTENPPKRINYRQRWGSPKYREQLRRATDLAAAIEKELITQGCTNTIHDCWEKEID